MSRRPSICQLDAEPELKQNNRVKRLLPILAVAGGVLLAQLARADEAPTFLQTAVSSTVISGYVNTSAQWDLPQPSDFSQSSISAVPEPATLSLLGLGGLVAGSFIRRRRPVTR